jgi:hypothetical protein
VAGGCRRLYNEDIHNLYTSPNIVRVIKSRRMRLAGYVACMEDMRNPYKILVIKLEGRRQLGRPRHGWEDNIRVDLREIGWKGVN